MNRLKRWMEENDLVAWLVYAFLMGLMTCIGVSVGYHSVLYVLQ